ncbi:MAG: ATP-binding protein [Myxococcales bacterium]|nr:MAG: ATP-binding protein [Myxococcales bacterium]
MVDAVVERLVKDHFLVVHGDSGSGKSSLIAAGVLPNLEQGVARGGARWRTCSTTPGQDPLWNLARAMAGIHASAPKVSELRSALNFGRDAAVALAKLLRRDTDDHFCILFDQFEELFARGQDSSEAKLVAELLIGLHESRVAGLYAVLTMRSEFLGACARFRGFAEVVNECQYLLPAMDDADLVRAIQEPMTLYGGVVEQDFTEHMIAGSASAQDQLPLIQHGLMHMYCRLPPAGEPSSGGKPTGPRKLSSGPGGCASLGELLSRDADDVADAATKSIAHVPGTSRVVEDIFRALTDVNADGQAIRRPQTLAQLVATTGAEESVVRVVVDAFRAESVSFLRPYGRGQLSLEQRVDIGHEALIRCWRRLAEPIDGWLIREFKNGLVWRSLLVQADSFDKNESSLLSPQATEEREKWLKRRNQAWSERYGGGWARVQKLVEASAQRAAQDRRVQLDLDVKTQTAKVYRIVALAVSLLALGALILAGYAWRARREEQQAYERELEARSAAAAEQKRTEQLVSGLRQLTADTTDNDLRPKLEGLIASSKTGSTPPSSLVPVSDVPSPSPAPVIATAPRLYIHYSVPTQREAALQLGQRMQGKLVGSAPVEVPAARMVKYQGRNELRCFRKIDCKASAELRQQLGAQLKTGVPALADYSASYENSTAMRPGHYELWLTPDAL